MEQTYILDTSVILSDPNCLESFSNSTIIIQEGVLAELDKIKTSMGEVGKNARVFIKKLDALSEKGDVVRGIKMKNNTLLKIDVELLDASIFGDSSYVDNKILACAFKHNATNKATIVSRDINLRLRAKAFGINSENYVKKSENFEEFYQGYRVLKDPTLGHILKKKTFLKVAEFPELKNLHPNECLNIVDEDGKSVALGREIEGQLVFLHGEKPWGLGARNVEQAMAMDLLMDPDVPLVSLSGIAGTGKTLITVACGLESVINLKTYNKLIIYRPLQPVGKDIGYLPGDMEEKLDPWMGAIKDSMELLTSPLTSNRRKKKFGQSTDWKEAFSRYMDQIHLEALTHIRGRSINNAFIVMDECFPYNQNIKTENGKEKIGKIYKKFKRGEKIKVKTFNEEKKCFEYKLVTNAWEKGFRSLIQLKMGNRKIKCTPNHKFLTENGWKPASDIELGELILTSEPDEHQLLNSLNEDQFNLMVGSYLGDGSINKVGDSRYRVRVQHGINQNNYCSWKADLFGAKTSYIEKNGYSQKPAVRFQSKCFGLNKKINDKKQCPQWIIESLNEASFAIWYMDDGWLNGSAIVLSTCSFDKNSHERLISGLKRKFGIDSRIANYRGYDYIYINPDNSKIIFKKINKFIHPSMEYKIPENFRAKDKYLWNKEVNSFGFTVLDSKIYLPKQEKVYDIEVEDNHNFILCSSAKGGQGLGGPIVHNCQNISKKDIKTLLTRVGHGTKIVLTGDIEQIDNGNLDAMDNGLTNTIDAFRESPLAGHITLVQGERSLLAEEATKLL